MEFDLWVFKYSACVLIDFVMSGWKFLAKIQKLPRFLVSKSRWGELHIEFCNVYYSQNEMEFDLWLFKYPSCVLVDFVISGCKFLAKIQKLPRFLVSKSRWGELHIEFCNVYYSQNEMEFDLWFFKYFFLCSNWFCGLWLEISGQNTEIAKVPC
jgi:hypothetical protein